MKPDFLAIVIFTLLVGMLFAAGSGMSASLKTDRCETRAAIQAQIVKRTPQASMKLLAGKMAANYIAALNAIPPVSRLVKPDELLIIGMPAAKTSMFTIGFRGGCRIGHFQIRKTLHKRLMRIVAGPEV